MSHSFATPWTIARQAPLSIGFLGQEYWGGLPFPSPLEAHYKTKSRVTVAFLGGSDGKESTCNVADLGLILGLGRFPRRAWQPTPVFLPGESPWTEEPGELQSLGSQRVGHD